MLLKGISRLLSVTLAGSMQVLFNAPSSAFVLRRLRLVLHPSQIHQPRYFHCVSTSQVSQKRGRPEHPTPLPCIAINRVFPRKVGLYAHLACGTKLAKHAVIGAPSSKAFVRRPLLPCPVPFMICGQPIFRESPPPLPLLLSLAKEWPICAAKLPTFFSRRRSQQQHLLRDGRHRALWPWRPSMIRVFDSVVSS